MAETEARAEVVRGYVKKARRRLDRLRGRYKDLIVGGRRDVRAETGGYRSSSSSSSSSSYDAPPSPSPSPSASYSSRTGGAAPSGDDDVDDDGPSSYSSSWNPRREGLHTE